MKEAIEAYKQALRLDPDKSKSYLYISLGECHLAQGNQDEAMKAFRTAMERDPGLISEDDIQSMLIEHDTRKAAQ